MQSLHDQDLQKSTVVLSNAATLVGQVIFNLMGNDIGNSLNANRLKLDALYGLASSRFKQRLERRA